MGEFRNGNGLARWWPMIATVGAVLVAVGATTWQVRALAEDQKRQDTRIEGNASRGWQNDKRISVLETEVRANIESINRALVAQTEAIRTINRKLDRRPSVPDWR